VWEPCPRVEGLGQHGSNRREIGRGPLPLDIVKKVALLLLIGALLVTFVWMIWLANRPTAIESTVLSEAETGAFPLEGDYTYDGQVECRVEDVEAFHGEDLFICRLGLNGVDAGGQYVYAALVDGVLHTHQTDPADIPARAFDPGF
jgi:hypothetical protein